MEIKRHFTSTGSDNFLGVDFVLAKSQLKSSSGEILFDSINVEVPANWPQISIDILVQKYFRRNGVPSVLKKIPENNIPDWLYRSEPDLEALEKLPLEKRYIGENSAKQVFHRIAGTWTYWGYKNNYFNNEEDALVFFQEIQFVLANQIASPNSPQWFNTGLHWAYGITGSPQGHYYFDENLEKVVLSKNAYERPQPHACFIQNVEDDLVSNNGIMDLITKEVRLFKYGSGTGANFSKIRGKGEKLSGGGYSSGVMSFLKIADTAAGAIKSGGTTRRAAKMVVLDLDHPDIEDFINWKVKEEQKVVSLVTGSIIAYKAINNILKACKDFDGSEEDRFSVEKNISLKKAVSLAKGLMVPDNYLQRTISLAHQGYYDIDFNTFSTDWNSESYQTVSGQNSNNSISIKNDFLHSLEKDGSWNLYNRTDQTIAKTLKSKDLWSQITYAAWACADPGIHFSSTINEWHTCPNDGKIEASNPCSEYLFLNDTACNLASLNIMKFRKDDGSFDVESYTHAIRLLVISLEISVLMAQFPSANIAYLSYKFRTLGLGYANIGAYLMSIGLPYDSDEGRNICSAITALLSGTAYKVSAEIAQQKGVFLGYYNNKEEMLRVIRNHRKAVYGGHLQYEKLSINPIPLNDKHCPDKNLIIAAQEAWDQALIMGEKYGYRNAQVTCIAPTGTIGLLMDCSTTGIEPDFSLVKYKSLAGGGYFKIINHTVPISLKYLGYSDKEILDITNYIVGSKTLKNAPKINHDSLKNKGFTDDIIKEIETSLENIFHISFAFNKYSIGEDFCINNLGIKKEKLDSNNFSILEEIGFSQKDIEEANLYVVGTMTIEGAPHINQKHLSVFDCANLCGPLGKRYLSYESHIKMLATAQTFISGAISKTINMPSHASVEDCSNAYLLSWKLGVKATALYRDSSKLSQPLQSSLISENYSLNLLDDLFNNNYLTSKKSSYEKVIDLTKNTINKSIREYPKDKRSGYTQKATIGGHKLYLHTGEYQDGRLAEIFLDVHKEGVALRSMMNCFAIAVSIGLQYGVPLEEYVDSFTFTRFEPSGMVEGHNNIKMATSMIDYIFRDLAINYLGRYDLGHVNKIETNTSTINININENNIRKEEITGNKIVKNFSSNNNYKNKGFEGEECPQCHNLTMVRNGTCLVCTTCGTTTGCS